jgi:hypothetical protein
LFFGYYFIISFLVFCFVYLFLLNNIFYFDCLINCTIYLMSISFIINIFVYSCGFDDTHQLVLHDYVFSRIYKIYLMARFTNSPMFLFLLNPIVRFFLNYCRVIFNKMPVLPDYSLKYFSFRVIMCNECEIPTHKSCGMPFFRN